MCEKVYFYIGNNLRVGQWEDYAPMDYINSLKYIYKNMNNFYLVDGAIHKAAGKSLLAENETLLGCQNGDAKISCGYKLPAKCKCLLSVQNCKSNSKI